MLTIGLTGGIGCGKSALCEIFQKYAISIIDTDLIAKNLVQLNCTALEEIKKTFGNQVLHTDGTLNRLKMRQLIFNDPLKKQQLEAILHPKIYSEVKQALQSVKSTYCIVAIPLLVETQSLFSSLLDRIATIECHHTIQIKRIMNRDNINQENAVNIIQNQASREERIEIADDVIYNNGTLDNLIEEAKMLHQLYLKLSNNQ